MDESSNTDTGNDPAANVDDAANVEDTSSESTESKDQNGTDTGAEDLNTSNADDSSADDDSEEEADDTPASKFDKDIDSWAEKTGRTKPETDEDRVKLQAIRDDARSITRPKEAATNFNKTVEDAKPKEISNPDDDADPLAKKVAELEASNKAERAARLQSEYFGANNISAKEADMMGEIVKEKTEKGGKAAFDFWSDPANLEDLHTLAKVRLDSPPDNKEIADEAARKERERIEKESKGRGSNRNASNVVSGKKTPEQERLDRFKAPWAGEPVKK